MKKIVLLLFAFSSITIQLSGQQVSDGINAARFGLSEKKDATPPILDALDACYESGASRLIIPKGTYHFYPNYALEDYLAITGSSNGLRRIAFPLFNFENLIIDGYGSTFIFHGMMLPFELQECKNISIRNIKIRFVSSVWGEGTVTEVEPDKSSYSFSTNPGDSIVVENGILSIKHFGENLPIRMLGWLRVDSKGSCSFVPSPLNQNATIAAKPLRMYNFLVEAPAKSLPHKGWKLIWGIESESLKNKISPAFHLSGSDGVTLSNLSVQHIPGRAIVAEQSGNVMLDRVNVLPDSLIERKLSVQLGVARFIGCEKQLVITNSRFRGVIGDAITVSGPILKVIKRIGDNALGVSQVNEKQWGSQFAQVDDTIRFVDPNDAKFKLDRLVTRVRDLNEQYQEIYFDRPLPQNIQKGILLTNVSRQPDVILRGNRLENVIGNGMKLETSGRITVDGNQISSGKNGINLGGAVEMAFRPVALNQVMIKNNILKRCDDVKGNEPQIFIGKGKATAPDDTTCIHKDITIEMNTFYNDGKSVLETYATSGLIFRQNTVNDLSSGKMNQPLISLWNCHKVGIVRNRYLSKQQAYMKTNQVKDLLFFNNEGIVSP